MKILFDSEEEKTKFLNHMASIFCPSDICENVVDVCECDTKNCQDCCENCGLIFEVKEEEVEK